MKTTLVTTSNSLADILNWLTNGHIICMYSNNKIIHYFFKETLDKINSEIIVYINLKNCPELLDDDEWPWYIKNEGFTEYKSIDILPKKESSIYYLEL